MLAAIIQARMGSTRLPGKTLMPVCGKPLLQHLIERVEASRFLDELVIATTTKAQDDELVEFAQKRGLKYYRGSEEDVLDRTYQAARHFGVEHIVRVTPDCPLLDPKVIDRVIETYLSGRYDYVTNTLRYTYPDGLDVEVFSFSALEQAWKEARVPSEREHVTSYMRTCADLRVFNVESPVDLSEFKWSVDTEDDLAFVRSVCELMGDKETHFDLDEVLLCLRHHPELKGINQRSVLNEGYYKSLAANPPVSPRELPVTRSYELKARAENLIPSATQTLSKGPTQFVQGVAPVFMARGDGSHVWDVDGNEYIDWMMALGPVILGHNYPRVTEEVTRQMQNGVSHSLSHPLEIELAELLVEVIPCAEMVRFGKNGSDVTSGAVRVARAYTGRDMIACCGYHGWQDWYAGLTSRNAGVPESVKSLTHAFEYNEVDSLKNIFSQHPGQIAAVIMEPVGVEEPIDGFLQKVRELAHAEGAILIFDEIITGFRLDLGGAQKYYGVSPDLACVGKAMANGYPLSAVVGRREIMEWFDRVFFSFTFGGETLSLQAAVTTISEMRDRNVIAHLWEQGRKLKDGYNVLSREFGVHGHTRCIGLAPHTVLTFHDEHGADSLLLKSLFQQECLKRGILTAGYHNVCYSHTDKDVDTTLMVYRTALEILSQAISDGDAEQRLEGKPVEAVVRLP